MIIYTYKAMECFSDGKKKDGKKRPNPQLFAMNPVWLFKVPRQFHTSNISRDMIRTDLRLGDLNSDKLSVGQIQEALRLGLLVPM